MFCFSSLSTLLALLLDDLAWVVNDSYEQWPSNSKQRNVLIFGKQYRGWFKVSIQIRNIAIEILIRFFFLLIANKSFSN